MRLENGQNLCRKVRKILRKIYQRVREVAGLEKAGFCFGVDNSA